MKIEFLGAAHEVTGSCHYIECAGKRMLIDCGMEQGADLYENQEIPVDAAQIDYVFLTHAHIDHSGSLPLLYKQGFRGRIYATNATTQLCRIMLKDSAHIQESEAEWKNRKSARAGKAMVEPMYTLADAESALNLFVPCPYGEQIDICDGISLRFKDAGHLLGSAFIEFILKESGSREERITFSGDVGTGNRALIRDPEAPASCDYLVIESTYGDRLHDAVPDYAVELAKVLNMTFARGGNVVIPAFAVGRTQEMLYFLRRIKEEHLVTVNADFEVYLDSPLAVEATNIFNKNVIECFRDEDVEMIKSGRNPIRFHGLEMSVTTDDSIAINSLTRPAVIISASGMCEAGRIRHHLKHNLWREECSIVFVGYQVPGTLGHTLLSGAKQVRLFGEDINVAAQIIRLPGISAHADKNQLTGWVQKMPAAPGQIFVVHGEDEVTDHFAEHLRSVTGAEAAAPYSGDAYDLVTGEHIQYGARVRVQKKSAAAKKSSAAFDRLMSAGERLLRVIRQNKEGANKDLKKFTAEIDRLSDKWEK